MNCFLYLLECHIEKYHRTLVSSFGGRLPIRDTDECCTWGLQKSGDMGSPAPVLVYPCTEALQEDRREGGGRKEGVKACIDKHIPNTYT